MLDFNWTKNRAIDQTLPKMTVQTLSKPRQFKLQVKSLIVLITAEPPVLTKPCQISPGFPPILASGRLQKLNVYAGLRITLWLGLPQGLAAKSLVFSRGCGGRITPSAILPANSALARCCVNVLRLERDALVFISGPRLQA
jgi:hypothetical protein